ncbi:hypothetical protein ACQJBY_045174 [Aegilops geniculata]
MATDFPVSPVSRLPIFSDQASSAAEVLGMIGTGRRAGGGGGGSANGSRGGIVCGLGISSRANCSNLFREEASVDAGGGVLSAFSESEGDNAEEIENGGHQSRADGHQEAVICDRAESANVGSAQSTRKADPQAPRWTKRVRVGKQPLDRAPCPERVGALEKTIRGYAKTLGDRVVEPSVGITFDSLGEVYDFYNLYSWELGFGIRYGKSRLNSEKTKCMQEVVYGGLDSTDPMLMAQANNR